MKKLFVFLGVLAMSAGVMFAQQNTSDIDQDGNDNVATVMQDDDSENNTADVDQAGHGNQTVIEQPLSLESLVGDKPESIVNTLQEGNDNEIYVRQQYNRGGNYADVHQEGHDNNVHLIQDNINNVADIEQWGNGNAATLNLQRNFVGGEDGEGYVHLRQKGHENTAFIDQDGEYGNVSNYIHARQVGNNNYLDVDQMKGDSEEAGNDAHLRQEGHGNVLRLEQVEAPSYANILQKGNDNRVARTDEDFGFSPYGHAYQEGSQITITQDGHGNEVGLYQENTWTDSEIMQIGNDNQTLLYQTDGNGYANVHQNGHGNQANVWQSTE